MSPRGKTPTHCPTCGEPHAPAKCQAHRKSDGKQCTNDPLRGLRVCRMHGGSTKRAKAKSERKQAEDQAHAAVVTFGLPREVHPAMALLEEVHRTAGHVAWLAAQVATFDPQDLTWGVSSEVAKRSGEFPGTDTTSSAAPPVLLELYRAERKHLVDVCTAALKAGVEERRVRLAESQGEQLALVIRAILDDLRLTSAQQTLVGEVVPRHLRALGATA